MTCSEEHFHTADFLELPSSVMLTNASTKIGWQRFIRGVKPWLYVCARAWLCFSLFSFSLFSCRCLAHLFGYIKGVSEVSSGRHPLEVLVVFLKWFFRILLTLLFAVKRSQSVPRRGAAACDKKAFWQQLCSPLCHTMWPFSVRL